MAQLASTRDSSCFQITLHKVQLAKLVLDASLFNFRILLSQRCRDAVFDIQPVLPPAMSASSMPLSTKS